MPPTVTVAANPTPVPLMDIGVPPLVDPMFGTNSLMTAGGMNWYPPGTLRLCALGDTRDTVTSTFPAAWAGKTYNHPAMTDGILLVRNVEEMAAFDLTKAAK